MRELSHRSRLFTLGMFMLGILVTSNSHAYYEDHTVNFDFAAVTEGHELGCLALNVYHEGRGESLAGQSAIAAVTMNRVRSELYPDSVCRVVWQRKQFSWTHIAARHHVVTDFDAWEQALVIARLFLDGAQISEVGTATHYHADTVEPYWMADNEPVGKVGNHYFYAF